MTLTLSEARILLMSMLETMQGRMLNMEDPNRGLAGNTAASKLQSRIHEHVVKAGGGGQC